MKISPDIFENTEVAFAAKSNTELYKAQALFSIMANNALVNTGSALAQFALGLHLPVSPIFKWTIYGQFCGGETFDECKRTIAKLDESHVGVLLNYGVELKETDEDFDTTLAKNMEALEFAGKNRSVKALCVKLTGYGRFALFEKIQQNEKLDGEEKKEFEKVKKRFAKICSVADKQDVPLYVDAEESWIQDTLDDMVEEMMAKHNQQRCIVFNTFQLYRHDRLAYLQQQIDKAKAGGYLLGAKLVRGAYMEKERARAKEMSYPSPIHKNKKAVDKDFDAAVSLCLDNLSDVYVCIASQSEESNLLAIEQAEKKKIGHSNDRVIFSQLYGMGDGITFNLAKLGFNATKYLPYGPVKDVIPYLLRRADENTSVAGQTTRELDLINKEIKRRKRNR
ncbi:MAG TPA: proline dehydrogenase family protein [Chitinophagales bacterium]|nr:proline dehydrogenase family protein [Chitinophagales bacterium]